MIARLLTPEFRRFLVTGAVNTAASYAMYFVLLQALPYLVAYTLAYASGIIFSYLLTARFVFRAPARWATALRFPLVYLAQYVIGSTTIYALVEHAGVTPWLAAVIAMLIVVPTTFLLARLVFRR
ncbi:MAG: GtrA family protein [Pseudomonadota bacterium]|nr:GtrA family protein [Pseudomonadota bacterium]